MKICRVKDYRYNTDNRYKIILTDLPHKEDYKKKIEREDFQHYDDKLENSISRSKKTIVEYCLCNKWDYFVTFTVDKMKEDRYDVDGFMKKFLKWIANLGLKDFKYVLIPELHLDGAVHVHGVVAGLPVASLVAFDVLGVVPVAIIEKINAGFEVYSWVGYANRFGFNTCEKIKNSVAMSFYVIKYLEKKPAIDTLNKRMFFSSKGLAKPETLEVICDSIVTMNCTINRYLKYDFCDIAYTNDISELDRSITVV